MSKSPDYSNVLNIIEDCEDSAKLERFIGNARREGAAEVENAARRRLVGLVPGAEPGSLEHDFWQMVHAFELARSEEKGKKSRLSRTRQKATRVGEVQTLRDWALGKGEPTEVQALLDYGMADLTGEAIVLRHRQRFDPEVVESARARLEKQGIDTTAFAPVAATAD